MLPLALRGPAGGSGAVEGMSARVDPKLGESKFNLGNWNLNDSSFLSIILEF